MRITIDRMPGGVTVEVDFGILDAAMFVTDRIGQLLSRFAFLPAPLYPYPMAMGVPVQAPPMASVGTPSVGPMPSAYRAPDDAITPDPPAGQPGSPVPLFGGRCAG